MVRWQGQEPLAVAAKPLGGRVGARDEAGGGEQRKLGGSRRARGRNGDGQVVGQLAARQLRGLARCVRVDRRGAGQRTLERRERLEDRRSGGEGERGDCCRHERAAHVLSK